MTLSVGQPIAAFSGPATGGTFDSAAQTGKKLVVYFYPKDNTPGCTTQACEFRDDIFAFRREEHPFADQVAKDAHVVMAFAHV